MSTVTKGLNFNETKCLQRVINLAPTDYTHRGSQKEEQQATSIERTSTAVLSTVWLVLNEVSPALVSPNMTPIVLPLLLYLSQLIVSTRKLRFAMDKIFDLESEVQTMRTRPPQVVERADPGTVAEAVRLRDRATGLAEETRRAQRAAAESREAVGRELAINQVGFEFEHRGTQQPFGARDEPLRMPHSNEEAKSSTEGKVDRAFDLLSTPRRL